VLLPLLSLCAAESTEAPVIESRDGTKNAKEVYVYSGSVSQSPYPGGFQLLSSSDKHNGHVTIKPKPSVPAFPTSSTTTTSTTTRRPVTAVSTETPILAKEALLSLPPSVKVIEGRPSHGSYVQFPSGEAGNLISSTKSPSDIDFGGVGTDILGEAIDQEALGTIHSHTIISECDGEECCPGPHCTKDLICRHGEYPKTF